MPSLFKLFYALLIIFIALSDGIFWLRILRKPQPFGQWFSAIVLLVAVITMSLILAFAL
jgi:hypothetical protein